MELRKNLGSMLNRVDLTHESIIITRSDRPIAVLIDLETFNRSINYKGLQSTALSAKDFSNTINIDLKNYHFNRDEANER